MSGTPGDFGLQARSKSYFRTGKSIHSLRKQGVYTSWHLPLGHSPLGLLLLGLLPHGLLPPPGRRFLCRRSLGRDCLSRGFLVVDVETMGHAGAVCT